jgi:hypothetical protein
MDRFGYRRLADSLKCIPRVSASEMSTDTNTKEEPDEIAAAIDTLLGVSPLDIQRRGYHFQRRDYYSPLNDLEFLADNYDLWKNRPLPAGIEWNLAEQLALVRQIGIYVQELQDVPFSAPRGSSLSYYWNNDFWRGIDAFVHYALLRHIKPIRVVEIGCGWSSLLLKRALHGTEISDGVKASVHQIEPYPRSEIMAVLPDQWTQDRTILQRATYASIEELRDGDVLFYDGSHVAKAASDVNWFFFEILPRVSPGVIIHLHDIFWPADYPETWIFERGQTWNEQYILQAFLMYNQEFDILLANAALTRYHRAELQRIFQGLGDDLGGGGSVWLKRRATC